MGVIMIRCPQTGREIPTGIEMDTAEFQHAPVFFSRVQCPVCARANMNGSPRMHGCAIPWKRIPHGTHSLTGYEEVGSPRVSAPDGFCRGEGGTPPGAGVTTRWPRLQGQRNCGELVPADGARFQKVFARAATAVCRNANNFTCAAGLPHTLQFKE